MFSAPSGESWLIPDLGQFDLTSRESDLNACTYKCMNCLLFIIELKQWNFLASLKAAPRLPWCLASRPKNRFLASQNWPRSAIIASCKCHLFNSKIIHDFWDMGSSLDCFIQFDAIWCDVTVTFDVNGPPSWLAWSTSSENYWAARKMDRQGTQKVHFENWY